MYTLRVIEQKQGVEERYNKYLGTSYRVSLRTSLDEKPKEELDCDFEKVLKDQYGDMKLTDEDKKDIVGFISCGSGSTHEIRSNQVVYIVGLDGKTIERVYGLYNKR